MKKQAGWLHSILLSIWGLKHSKTEHCHGFHYVGISASQDKLIQSILVKHVVSRHFSQLVCSCGHIGLWTPCATVGAHRYEPQYIFPSRNAWMGSWNVVLTLTRPYNLDLCQRFGSQRGFCENWDGKHYLGSLCVMSPYWYHRLKTCSSVWTLLLKVHHCTIGDCISVIEPFCTFCRIYAE